MQSDTEETQSQVIYAQVHKPPSKSMSQQQQQQQQQRQRQQYVADDIYEDILSPVIPCTPETPGIQMSTAAANAANEKRGHTNSNKTIMNYFRDRSGGYSRTNNNRAYTNNYERIPSATKSTQQQVHHTETVVYLKEPRSRTNILTLLKTSSTRDLTQLIEPETTQSMSNTNTSSSCSSATSWEHKDVRLQRGKQLSTYKSNNNNTNNNINNIPVNNNNYCCNGECKREMKQLRERVAILEQHLEDQRTLSNDLEVQLQQLSKRLDEAIETKAVKRKKSFITRKKSNTTNPQNVQPSKLATWMNLSNWFKHRPSIETLKEQNIYNDEPCFDTEIELVLKHETHKTIPKIIVDCCDLIEDKYRKSPHPIEGIYRQCGDYNKIQTLRFQIDANDYQSLRQPNIDIHTLTGVLKLFLREIKSPLVSANEAKTFIGKPNQWLLTDLNVKIDILRRLIRSLPEVNRDTMDYLFAHLNRLPKVPLQQVSAETLSLSITPSIFHTVQEGVHIHDIHVLLKESEVLADCVKIMIEYHSRIFE